MQENKSLFYSDLDAFSLKQPEPAKDDKPYS